MIIKKFNLTLLAAIFSACISLRSATAETPIVQLHTDFGDITLALYADDAPKTVDNFLGYVNDGFYDGTLLHRVIAGFMIQGGGFSSDFELKQTRAPIENEANNGLSNESGTIAMARTTDPHSATAQFFINLVDNEFLDFSSESEIGWGYAVFGRVIDGMDVVDRIAATPTTSLANGLRDVPMNDIVINSARLIVESSDATYDPETLILRIPVVQVADQTYEATMMYVGGGLFDLTHLQALSANFAFPENAYDPGTANLHLERVRAGNTVYSAEISYIGGGQLQLTQLQVVSD